MNATITPAVTVDIQDAWGNLVPTATNTVTLSLSSNPGGATLGGTASKAAIGGVATFDNLSLDKAGTGYTLQATSGTLTAATSSGFNITAAASIVVSSPAAGNVWFTGGIYNIRWTCPPDITQVQIQYSWDDGVTWTITNFSDYVSASLGQYVWTIPTNNPYLISETARIKIIEYGGSGRFATSARFSVRSGGGLIASKLAFDQ